MKEFAPVAENIFYASDIVGLKVRRADGPPLEFPQCLAVIFRA